MLALTIHNKKRIGREDGSFDHHCATSTNNLQIHCTENCFERRKKKSKMSQAYPVNSNHYDIESGTKVILVDENGAYGVVQEDPISHNQIVYVVERDREMAQEDRNGAGMCCVLFGFIFSWIPIVGILTYIVNCDAPRGSPRAFWATAALCVSLFVLLFNIVFWPSLY
jgi:hypothetical protein